LRRADCELAAGLIAPKRRSSHSQNLFGYGAQTKGRLDRVDQSVRDLAAGSLSVITNLAA